MARKSALSGAVAGLLQFSRASAVIPATVIPASYSRQRDDVQSRRIFTIAGYDNMSVLQVARHPKSTNSALLVSHFSSLSVGAQSNQKDTLSQDRDLEIIMFEKWMAEICIHCKSPEEREHKFKRFKKQVELANACSIVNPEERDLEIKKMFEKWMVQYNRVYNSPEEKERRFTIFKKAVMKVNAHNKKEDRGYEKGINKFSDLTHKEFVAKYTGLINCRKRSK